MKFAMTPRFARILRRKHRYQERGVALAIALVLLGVLLVFTSVSATLMTTEARQTAADYQKTRTFNAAIAYLETITANVNRILSRSPNITADDLGPTGITSNIPPFLTENGRPLYTFTADTPFVPPDASSNTTVTVNDAPFNGMTALRRQFVLGVSARATNANEEARLIRQVNFYQIPAFQFAAFGFDCLQVSPGPQFYLGGRTHVNRHLYLGANNRAWFFGPVTVAGEVVSQITPSNRPRADKSLVLDPTRKPTDSSATDEETFARELADSVTLTIEPSLPHGKGPGGYSNNPEVYRVAPVNWLTNDINLAVGTGSGAPVGARPNNGGVGTPWGITNGHSPGKQRIVPLLLPTQTNGFNAIEILRRSNPNENLEVLRNSRFFEGQVSARATTIRILLDDDLDHFPPATSGGTRAYDLEALSNPNTALFQQFWVNDNPNVVQFNPLQGSDHPDQPASVLPAGSGGAPQKHNQSDTLATASGTQRRVLPPQTNLVNQQAYFQSTANNTDDTTRRKRTYIKIELLVNNNPGGNPNVFPTRYDITPHILNLGITAGPIPVLRDLPAANLAAGQPEPETTYAAVYALNDGGSVSRLQTQDPGNLPPQLPAVSLGKRHPQFHRAVCPDVWCAANRGHQQPGRFGQSACHLLV
jgi:Tfp pilus assembly protein PilX